MATKQREWQKKQVAAGRCQLCGKKRGEHYLCEECNDRRNLRLRNKKSANALESVASDR
jgi:hypothetical protein